MYIKFEQMMTSGLTMSDVGYLLMIRQKEEMAIKHLVILSSRRMGSGR